MATIRQFIQTIGRFFFWGWKLRNSYDWEFSYLDQMIHLKLKRMLKQFQNGPTVWGKDLNNNPPKQQLGRVFKRCVELSRRLSEHDYSEYTEKILDEKWGEYSRNPCRGESWFTRVKVKTPADKKKCNKDILRYYAKSEKQQQSERIELHRLLGKYGDRFWD